MAQAASSQANYRCFPLVDNRQALPYLAMTYPQYCCQLFGLSEAENVIAMAAEDGEPAGLALAEILPEETAAEVLSVFVVPERRGQGIASTLLAKLETELAKRGVQRVELTFPADKPTTRAVERLLQICGWPAPSPSMLLFHGGKNAGENLLDTPWLKPRALPEGFEIFPWTSLTDAERNHLSVQQARGEFPPFVSPLQQQELIEPCTSLGLRYRGRIAGWMITHRIAPTTIRYTYLFVRDDVPVKGMGLRLVAEAVRRHIQTDGHLSDACGSFGTFLHDRFAQFVQRRMLQSLRSGTVTTTMHTWKELSVSKTV